MGIFKDIFTKNKIGAPSSFDIFSGFEDNLWFLIWATQKEIIPRHDAMLAFNMQGDLALFILPAFQIHTMQGEFLKKFKEGSLVTLKRNFQGKEDCSYLAPIAFTEQQETFIRNTLKKYINGSGLDHRIISELQSPAWKKTINSMMENNSTHINKPSIIADIERVFKFNTPEEPDDMIIMYTNSKDCLPAYVYTNKNSKISLNKESLRRGLIITRMLSQERYNELIKQYDTDPLLVEVISRVETELTLAFDPFWKTASRLMLDHSKFDFDPSTLPYLFVRPEGKSEWDRLNHQKLLTTGCSMTTWDRTSTFLVLFNIGKQVNWMTEQCVKSPGIMVFKDNYGINTVPTHLFTVSAGTFTLQKTKDDFLNLDDLPAAAIPKIDMKSLSLETPKYWWHSNEAVYKMFWLACQNLCSHISLKDHRILLSLTTISDSVLLSVVTTSEHDAGAPNGYLIKQDETEINAIPVFPKDYIEYKDAGNVTFKHGMFIKNYTITNNGRRKQYFGTFRQMFGSVYESAIKGNPKQIYSTANTLEKLKQKNVINAAFNLALGLWKLPARTKDMNCYGILTFIDGTIEIIAVTMEFKVMNAIEAANKLFGLKSPPLLDYEMQSTKIIQNIQSGKRDSNELPWSAVIPDRDARDICLCHKRSGNRLDIGILIDKIEPISVKLEMSEKECSQITGVIADVCRGYLSSTPLPGNFVNTLNQLIMTIRYDNQGQTAGSSGKLLPMKYN